MLKLLILAIGGFVSLFSYGSDYYDNFYQECNEENGKVTSEMTHNARSYCTPNGYDWPHCIEPEQLESLAHCDVPNLKAPGTIELFKQWKWYYNAQPYEDNIPPICFLASTSLGLHRWDTTKGNFRYYQCENGSKPKDTGNSPCANQNYTHTIAKAFNEVSNCFDFKDRKSKNMLFGLFHHESRFLNNKAEESGKTHRCFGQINNGFIATLNQYIYFGDRKLEGTGKPYASKFFEYGDIYKKAIKKCPFLEKTFTPKHSTLKGRTLHKELENGEKINPFRDAHLKNQQNFNSIICKTSQDIYSCLFYTMYNARVTLKKLEQYLKSHPEVNSMKIGKKEYKIFDDKDFYFKWAFVIWSHNAGREIITEDFENFTNVLKATMNSNYAKCNKCNTGAEQEECASCVNKYIKYKKSILNSKPLSGQILIKEFQQYAEKYKVSNQDQVKNIIDDIQKDLRAFTGEGKSLESAMKNLPQKSKGAQPRDRSRKADLDEFLQDVQYHCPTGI